MRPRADRRALAFRRSTAGSLRRINASAQLRPRFLGPFTLKETTRPSSGSLGVIGCHPHLPLSQSSELLAGRSKSAGRAVSGAARGRMYRPPAGTALVPPDGSTLAKGVPDERAGGDIITSGTDVNGIVTTLETYFRGWFRSVASAAAARYLTEHAGRLVAALLRNHCRTI